MPKPGPIPGVGGRRRLRTPSTTTGIGPGLGIQRVRFVQSGLLFVLGGDVDDTSGSGIARDRRYVVNGDGNWTRTLDRG